MMNSQNIDMTDIKTEEIWVDVEIVAKLKGITKRAVRLSLNNDKYEWKTEACRGGYSYKIKLSTLEVELQKKYIEEYVEEINASGSEVIELNNLKIKQEKLISQSQKEMALAKYDLLNFWLEYRKECKKNKYEESNQTINQKFVEMYNSGIKSIAFPAISCGVYRFPLEEACKIATTAVKEFITANDCFEKVIFIDINDIIINIYNQII